MIAAATIPMTSPETAAPPKPRCRKLWQPDSTARLIYQWVKFEGKRQHWVAATLQMNQGNVSRTIERYEKWLAHAQPGTDGQLNPQERLRAQRWLTYERNELILASALRIAGDMEGFTDVTKTVASRPTASTHDENVLRTEYGVIDRSGVASRFLRLAFRINMEQLKLVEMEPLAPLPPLPADAFDKDEDGGEDAAKASGGRESPETSDDGEGEYNDEDEDQPAAELDESEDEAATGVEEEPAAGQDDLSPASAHHAHNCSPPELGASTIAADSCAGMSRR